METESIDVKKYQKSKNNFQCLGPCYQAGTKIIHPITMEIVTDNVNPFCAVGQWTREDPETGKKDVLLTDVCYGQVDTKSVSKKELQLNMLIPYVDFNAGQFLKTFYSVFSFEDGLNWIDKFKFKPINTRLRILNMCLTVYGDQVDIIDSRFIDFFIDVIKKIYIREIYNHIAKYIDITNNLVSLFDPYGSNEKIDSDDEKIIKINYIIKNFINTDEIAKFITRYFRQRKIGWDKIADHVDNMVSDLIAYIVHKINITLKI